MIDGLVLGVAMLASTGVVSPTVPAAPGTLARAAYTFELPESASLVRVSTQRRRNDQTRPMWEAATDASQAQAPKRFGKTDRVIAVALGVAGGWMAGAAVGYYSTADWDNPNDDTSGLKGVIIGAPIGAAVGGILGYWLTNR